MINANELRIGNIVYYDSAEGDLLTNRIDWQDLKWVSEDEKGFNLVHSPIPLTEEILLKAGFEKVSNESEALKYSLNGFDLVFTYDEWTWSPIQGAKIGTNIKYIHQLQNLYFALTGEELKIEL